MRRFIITLIGACMTLSILAATPRLTRTQLKQVQMTKDHKLQPSTAAGERNSLSLQQVLKQRNLTLDDNKLTSVAPSRLSTVHAGDKMVSADAYDFHWDESTATATVIDSTGAMIGKNCYLSHQYGEVSGWFLKNLFGDYEIPINVDASSGVVSISAGVALAQLITTDYVDTKDWVPQQYVWTVYVMPLSWLEGDNDYHDIQGVIHADGSIEFTDDFGFLVEKRDLNSDGSPSSSFSWGLSPIFKNLMLYNPNATHFYETNAYEVFLNELVVLSTGYSISPMGSGGSVPKPIKPRPVSISNTGTTKPVTPRDFTPAGGNKLANQDNNDAQVVRNESSNLRADLNPVIHDHAVPIYMYQFDDTTFMAYNLFNKDYCWNYMNIYPDSTVLIPAQPMGIDNYGRVLYNCSGFHAEADTLLWGNKGTFSQNSITWGNAYFCYETSTEDRYSIQRKYHNNKIEIGTVLSVVELLPAPENLTVTPSAKTAEVTWQDSFNMSWRLRYRRCLDTSLLDYNCDLNGDYDDVFAEIYQDWIILDEDGDSLTWSINPVDGEDHCFMSESWDQETGFGLDPDNWLISPLVNLQGKLRFTVWGDDNYPDKLMPYVCIDDPETLDDFTPLAMDDILMTSDKTEYTFDLLAFTGLKGHIAFRHYNSLGQSFVCIDDIILADCPLPEWTYISDLSTTNCAITDLMPMTPYEVQVQAFGDDAISAWTQPVTFTTLADIQTGDVNGDGQVKINDVSALISYLLNGDTTGINLTAADCNHDGEIKINDVSVLISYLLSGSW